ncbi:FIVAR domain-containing protein [Paenibacillus sp. CGMCC 1.16610]|uniref:cohesin domain-containing protein n=1 Tax=Paenibacillus TaxID=44249 RepID=UPI0015EEA298|nr:cohesin domain-containing protein [Paenibacillus sp. CGMCC 1.16610]MBA2937541.1 FIVAR domain-containing protein [Paenibacillus sp. CGMCC 1.16610]
MSKRIISVVATLAMLICMLAIVPAPKAAAAGTTAEINHVETAIDQTTQKVTFHGEISLGMGKDVTMMVNNPQGQLEYLNQTSSGEGGHFSFTYSPNGWLGGTYTFKIGGEGVAIPYAGSFQLASTGSPSATLTGPSSVLGGQPVDLKLGVSNQSSTFSILNVVLNYDPNLLHFDTVTHNGLVSLAEASIGSLKENFKVLVTGVKPEKGQVLILMSSIGSGNEVAGGDLLSLHAKANQVTTSVTTNVYVSDAAVSSNGAKVELDGASLSLQIHTLDKEALSTLIASAQSQHDAAVEGTHIGQYPSGSKQTLQLAINDAKVVRDNAAATEAEVQSALSSLDAALRTFINSVITTTDPEPGQADKEALGALLVSAQSKLDAVVVGTKVGQYASESKATLQAAVTRAKAVFDNASATQAQVDAAKDELASALQVFSNSIITLVPGATKITINDLSLIAKYYGTTSNDANWSLIEKADINNSNSIDIQDLAAVARMIIDEWLTEE